LNGSVLRRLLWGWAYRACVEALLARTRRLVASGQQPQAHGEMVLAGLAISVTVVPVVVVAFGWWLATGRGPGLRLFTAAFVAPRQRDSAARDEFLEQIRA
jgi:hypothetical protein